MCEAKLEPNSATALGSARARRASSGSGRWRSSARRWRRNWSPTLFSYNAGISACGKGMQWQSALSLINEMWEAKLLPNVISCSAAIRACDRAGKEQQAIWWLTETRDAKLESNVASFSDTLVLAMCKQILSRSPVNPGTEVCEYSK
ncbi:unnamed protein product [Prorocentrum cordatum]|uniref:Pentatricopeptide repeat-containing protein n=1 Tax=Prorocentrum cordatum TaxID=2364126 RepID=A0ABN9S6D3_9DINO|nr:unnamed protein product [Polarella glacialis]